MERKSFRLGEWLVQPHDCTLRSAESVRHLEPQLMDLLLFLASRAGHVVTKQEILDGVWGGTAVTEDSLTTSIYQLRRSLGDDARSPRFIETIPKRGYRLLATPMEHEEGAAPGPAEPTVLRRPRHALIAAASLIVVALVAIGFRVRGTRHPAGVRSLAVLPLKNLSPDPGGDYMPDGITAALITELAKIEPLRVISRTSVTPYRDSRKSTREIARELQVDAIVEGSVLRSGERVRIDARLIDATRDTSLWAESYERDIGDLLQLQQLIAQSIAHGIQVRLAPEGPAAAREPVPAAAMEAYLKGRSLLDQRNPETLNQVRLYFERARQIAPSFAEAAAGQADAYALLGYYGLADPADVERDMIGSAIGHEETLYAGLTRVLNGADARTWRRRDMKIKGVFPPATTPFDDRGEVDMAALRANLRRYLDGGVAGVVVLGTNGEAALLDDAEGDAVIAAARESMPADRVLIAGTARESTRAAVAASRRAASLGADAVLVRTPSAYKSQMTAEALAGYYTEVADASPAPVILYNFAAATGVNLAPALVARLAQHPNIVGIKDSNGDMAQIAELVPLAGDRFSVLVGSPQTFYTSLCLGADGGILAAACFAPQACLELYDLVKSHRHAEALALQQKLMPLIRCAFIEHGVAGLKVAVDAAGYTGGLPRPPMRPLPPAAAARIRDAVCAFHAASHPAQSSDGGPQSV